MRTFNLDAREKIMQVEDKSRLESENANVEDNMSLCVDETRR